VRTYTTGNGLSTVSSETYQLRRRGKNYSVNIRAPVHNCMAKLNRPKLNCFILALREKHGFLDPDVVLIVVIRFSKKIP